MKKNITILSAILLYLIISCTQQTKKPNDMISEKEKTEQKSLTIDEIVTQELKSGIIHDTIFLNLRFGMTYQEVKQELYKLEKKKKIVAFESNNKNLKTFYEFVFDEKYGALGHIYFIFYNNTLIRLNIIFTEQGINRQLTSSQINEKLAILFSQKYGTFYETKASFHGSNYHWINGNRHITIAYIADLDNPYHAVEYTDTKAQKEIEEAENNAMTEKALNTSKDI